MKKRDQSYIGGFTANSLVVPLGAVLLALIVAIAILTMGANWSTNELADQMQKSSDYQQSATNLQAGTSALSETASSFLQAPVIPDGQGGEQINLNPLQMYAEELRIDRRPARIAALFEEYDVSEEILENIKQAAEYSEQMQEIQTHALSLFFSVYDMPDDPSLSSIQLIELTPQEKAMPAEARIGMSKQLIFSKDYSLLKPAVSGRIEESHKLLQQQFDTASKETHHTIIALRTALWTMIGLLIFVMGGTFLLFYRWMVKPLREYAQNIASDQTLKRHGRVKELRAMVTAHNDLFARRNKLEAILRAAAETDSLTGLPNRYSLERTIFDLDEEKGSLAVLLFDVNFLKKTNDTRGHLAGDQLLRTTALCIRENFGVGFAENCFRIGGDEFVAILRDCTEEDVQNKIERFKWSLEREKISVSVGYAFSGKADETTFKKLMTVADRHMYEHKKEMHDSASSED